MPNYAIIDSNNTVRNMIYFETEPDDMTPFVDFHSTELAESNLTHVKIESHHKTCAIGHKYNGYEFRPPQPYPSWKWDSDKLIWRPPVIHPDVWPSTVDDSDYAGYTWDEENKKWQSI